MRDGRTIYFADTVATPVEQRPQGYMLFKAGRWAWLANVLWRCLKQMRALHPYSTVAYSYTYTRAHRQKITEAMLSTISGILERRERVEDYAFVMGMDEFMEVAGDFSSMARVSAPFVLDAGPYGRVGYAAVWRGVPIHIAPTVSGVAAIPKAVIERRVDA